MTDIKIPHEYLPALRRMREGSIIPSDLAKVDEFIAAAEADAPPLPVRVPLVYSDKEGDERLVYAQKNGQLTDWRGGSGYFGVVKDCRDRLTPLRPTVAEADVEKAARAARAAYFDGPDYWDVADPGMRGVWMKTVRATLDALDIEVRP